MMRDFITKLYDRDGEKMERSGIPGRSAQSCYPALEIRVYLYINLPIKLHSNIIMWHHEGF